MKTIYDVVGVGFGPSNLALAAALSEQHSSQHLSAIFFEEKDCFKWHPDMLFDDAEMQISFFKDLVTLRNPTSPYSFLNYLQNVGRLSKFANLRNFYPSRIEFNDYLAWVAKQLNDYVIYSSKIINISSHGKSPHRLFEISILDKKTDNITKVIARNIVIATGGAPKLPHFINSSSNSEAIWHSSRYLSKIEKFKKQPNFSYNFCVVGGGQSATEIAYNLYKTFPKSTVTCVHRGYGYKPADDSEFVNEIFNPETVDLFFSMTKDVRQNLLAKHYDTNYAVVDAELIQKLYRIMYEESVLGCRRLFIKRLCSLFDLEETETGINAVIENTLSPGQKEKLHFDAVILATGYDYASLHPLLHSLKQHIQFDNCDAPLVSRHYKIKTHNSLKAGVYLQGYCEKTHGLSDTLLSNSALRAQEILHQLLHSHEAFTLVNNKEKQKTFHVESPYVE